MSSPPMIYAYHGIIDLPGLQIKSLNRQYFLKQFFEIIKLSSRTGILKIKKIDLQKN